MSHNPRMHMGTSSIPVCIRGFISIPVCIQGLLHNIPRMHTGIEMNHRMHMVIIEISVCIRGLYVSCNSHMHTGIELNPHTHTGVLQIPVCMLVPKLEQTLFRNGESPYGNFFVSLPISIRRSPYGNGDPLMVNIPIWGFLPWSPN